MVKKLNKVAKALGKASKLHKKQSNIIKKILGIDNLEYKIRLLERKNYWRDKYNGSKSIHN